MPSSDLPNLGKDHLAGCGQHIAQVKATVPAGQWCDGSHNGGQVSHQRDSGGCSAAEPAPGLYP